MKKKKKRIQPRHKVRCSRCYRNILESKLVAHMKEEHSSNSDKKKHKPKASGRHLGLIGEKKPLIKPSLPLPEDQKKKRASTGIPILSKNNQYPVGICRKCEEEVYFVPVELKSGRRSEYKYDMKPFQPHDCEGQVDPLDDRRTVRIFQPKNNPYKL